MSNSEKEARRWAREEAVEAAYQQLSKYHVDSQRVVFVKDGRKRAGGYGIVRRAELHRSAYLPTWLASRQYGPPQVVAVKQMRMSVADDPLSLKAAFTKELLVWSSLEAHPGIAKFLGFYADFERSEAWFLSPWEPHGCISEFLSRYELEVPEKLSLVYDTIDALAFLHQLDPPICHGDIKSANVLVNVQFRAVLCDFGLARLYEDSGFGRLETTTGFKGSIRWCSPELLDGQPRTPSSDVYAWAWLVWEIMTGQLPYGDAIADYVIIRKIFESPRPQVDGESRLGDCLQVWELMTRCWVVEPLQRPTSSMCRTTIKFLPRCPPTPRDAHHRTRSAELLENLGDLESWKGNYEEGLVFLEQALKLYEQNGNNRGVASVLRKQASISYRHSYHVKALDAASAALEKFKALSDPLGTAESMYLIGSALTVQSKEEAATPFLNQALAIYRTHSNDVGIVQCLERLGEIQRRSGPYSQALITLEEAVGIASRCGYKLGEAKALVILGLMQWELGDLEKGTSTLSKAYEMARSIGWDYGVSTTLMDLGRSKMAQQRYQEAGELLQESIAVARRCKFPWRLGQALQELGLCLKQQEKLDEAAEVLDESCSVLQNISLSKDAAFSANLLADVKKQQGSLRRALYWWTVTIAEHRKSGNKSGVSECLARRAEALEELGQYDEAALHFEASLVLSREIGSPWYVGWYRSRLSNIPKTTIKWESQKDSWPGPVGTQQASRLLCDLKKLQRRLPQFMTPSPKFESPASQGRDSRLTID